MRELVLERQGLMQLAQMLTFHTVMVEVGSCVGESAEIFLQSGNVDKITCVDKWSNEDEEQGFRELMPQWEGKLFCMKSLSEHAASSFENESLDFVYIDACHRYEAVKQDIDLWLPKIKHGGMIGGHDYSWGHQGVLQAVFEKFGSVTHSFCDASWLVDMKRRY